MRSVGEGVLVRSLRERGGRDAELTLWPRRRLEVAVTHVWVGMEGLGVVDAWLGRS